VEHEGGRGHALHERPRVRGEVQLEERRGDVGVRRVPLVAAQRVDRLTVGPRHEQPGQHLRRERPVRPHEVDQRALRRDGDVRAGEVAPEEHELGDPLRRRARQAERREARARAGEDRGGLVPARVEDGRERTRLRLDRRHKGVIALRQPGAEAVVADDAMRARELLEEASGVRILPLLLEVGHPAAAEEQRRALARRRVGDPAPVELAEADLLLH
jgi:hypothetical protein